MHFMKNWVLSAALTAIGFGLGTPTAYADLVGEWLLDEGSGSIAYDTSGHIPSHDGTLMGDATWVSPGANGSPSALCFDGEPPPANEDYVDLGPNLLGGPTFDELIVDFFVRVGDKPDGYNYPCTWAVSDETSDGEFNIGFDSATGNAVAQVYAAGGGGAVALTGPDITGPGPHDGWHHLRVEMTSSETALYVNDMTTPADWAASWGPLEPKPNHWKVSIGGKYTDDLGGRWYGCIDEVRILPEPTMLSLLLFGGLVALKRRR